MAGRNSIELRLAAVGPAPTSFIPLKLEPAEERVLISECLVESNSGDDE